MILQTKLTAFQGGGLKPRATAKPVRTEDLDRLQDDAFPKLHTGSRRCVVQFVNSVGNFDRIVFG